MSFFSFLRKHLKTPFQVVFVNKRNLVEEYQLSTRLWYSLIFILLLLMGLGILGYFARDWFRPGPSIQVDKVDVDTVRELEERIEDLQARNASNETYIQDIQKIMNGETPSQTLTQEEIEAIAIPSQDSIEVTTNQNISEENDRDIQENTNSEENLQTNSNFREEKVYQFYFTPLNGVITNGYQPLKNHAAIDIQGQIGAPIKSIADGVVLFSDWTSSTGYVVMIQHANNVISVYKHNAQVYKKMGSTVRMGEVIAAVGNTGELTSGPHLHLEMWVNGVAENPEKFISF